MKVISIEGSDYSGKTSTAKVVEALINATGLKSKYIKIPDYTIPSGERIARYLSGEDVYDNVDDIIDLYAKNREDLFRDLDVSDIDILILDRCYLSNICTLFSESLIKDDDYLGSLLDFHDKVRDYEYTHPSILQVDEIFVLTCDDEAIGERMSKRNDDSVIEGGAPDIHETIDRITFARDAYVTIASVLAYYIVDTSSNEVSDTAAKITSRIGETL